MEDRGSLNKNWERRDSLLNFEDRSYIGGVKRFKLLDLETLKKLIEEHFIYIDDCQNSSPSVNEFYEFMIKNPKVKAHGYAVSHTRMDYRVSIEGLHYYGRTTKQMIIDFSNFCHAADSFEVSDSKLYSWWD